MDITISALSLDERAALERLLLHAKQPSSTGEKCTDFLLACYQACGSNTIDVMNVWNVSDRLLSDMVTVLVSASRSVRDRPYEVIHSDILQQIEMLKQK